MVRLLCLTSSDRHLTSAQHVNGRALVSLFSEEVNSTIFGSPRGEPDPRLKSRGKVIVKRLPKHLTSIRILLEMMRSYDVLFYPQPGLAEDLYLRCAYPLIRFRPGRRLVTWIEGDIRAYEEIPGWLSSRIWRIIRSSQILVAISPFVASQLIAEGYRVASVIPVGVDIEAISRATSSERRTHRFRFITVASLKKWKQIDLVIEIARRLQEADFIIIGKGPERARLEAMAPNNVYFRGSLSQQEVFSELKSADAMIHTSRREGMPKAVLEAMASGLPVVLLNRYGAESFMTHEEEGLLANDVEELFAHSRRLIQEPQKRMCLGEAARRRAREFDWNIIARRWEDLLKETTS